MSQRFIIHRENPQLRLINEAVEVVCRGGIIIYPTDSSYAFGFHLGDKKARDRMVALRQFEKRHHFTLVCRDLSDLGSFAVVDNKTFKLIKAHTPGPYTFILPGSKELPRRVLNPNRKTIGLRVPDCKVTQTLLQVLEEPILSCSVRQTGSSNTLTDADEIYEIFKHDIDLMLDGGGCGNQLTTVIDLCRHSPLVLRQGKGDAGNFS